jgi:hypothetical protein
MKITRRVEEVYAEKVLAKIFCKAFRDFVNGNAARV